MKNDTCTCAEQNYFNFNTASSIPLAKNLKDKPFKLTSVILKSKLTSAHNANIFLSQCINSFGPGTYFLTHNELLLVSEFLISIINYVGYKVWLSLPTLHRKMATPSRISCQSPRNFDIPSCTVKENGTFCTTTDIHVYYTDTQNRRCFSVRLSFLPLPIWAIATKRNRDSS